MSNNPKLSYREIEILNLISLGFSSKEVAAKLFVSAETIKTHRCNILKKMQAKNVAHLIRIAANANLLNERALITLIPVRTTIHSVA
jgi:DNA-binding NarL/FixJ family response regulator